MTATTHSEPRWLADYRRVKAVYPGNYLLFYQVGDFFEALEDDAVKAADALGIALCRRGAIPMVGIPCHSHERYVAALEGKGFVVVFHQPKGGRL